MTNGFTHQLLQEYFASEVLGSEIDADVDPARYWSPQNWWEANGREETLIILAGVRGDPEGVARWVAPAQPELAVEVIQESGVEIALDEIASETRNTLVEATLGKAEDLNPVSRANAYRVLDMLDADERPGIGVVVRDGVALPGVDWVRIPAGNFIYGDDSKDSYPDYAKPADSRELWLPDFDISRHPVTYRQFQTFLDDPEGDSNRQIDWFEGLAADADDREVRDQYFKYESHPRGSVNWYQAMAFCRWWSWRLSGRVYRLDEIAQWPVRLPTEYEWEKAARGTEGRIYPYEGDFDAAKGNTSETGIGQTSAVGMFPDGASPDGVLDMSGNVFEWCLTDYENPQETPDAEDLTTSSRRVWRGGSWGISLRAARAAARRWYSPRLGDDGGGVRVVRPPS